MSQQCIQCSKAFKRTAIDMAFLQELQIPEPQLCPACTEQIRLIWRNEHSMYRGVCAKCGKAQVSIFNGAKPAVTYCNDCWWSDSFDPLQYGAPYDEQRSFFEQVHELLQRTPIPSLNYSNSENCEFTNFSTSNKNCYLIVASDFNEACLYSSYIFKSKDCIDCLFINNCDSCYQLVDSEYCYSSTHLQNCKQCIDCDYGYDLQNCSSCFGCVGLRHKQRYIFNEPYSQADYERTVAKLRTNPQRVQTKFSALKLQHPHKYAHNLACSNCSGDYLTKSENCSHCFDVIQSVDCRNSALVVTSKDVQNCNGVIDGEMIYESVGIPDNYHILFSVLIWPKSSYLEYCFWARSSHNCFGNVALLKNQFCILNTQYTEAEYQRLRKKIIARMHTDGEYGNFIPIRYAPFSYNETAAQDYYPLSKETIIGKGWGYKEPDDSLTAVGPDARQCQACGRPFRLTKQELEFYDRHHLTPPQQCFNDRRLARLAQRNPRQLWKRQCMCTQIDHQHTSTSSTHVASRCATNFETTYSPDRKEIVYCEQCYQKEIY